MNIQEKIYKQVYNAGYAAGYLEAIKDIREQQYKQSRKPYQKKN